MRCHTVRYAFACIGGFGFAVAKQLLQTFERQHGIPEQAVADRRSSGLCGIVGDMQQEQPGRQVGGPMCPNASKFTASDLAAKEATNGWSQEECTPTLYPAAKGEYLKEVVAEMERINVTAVVFGDLKSVQRWKDAAPGHVITGTSFSQGMQPGRRVPLDELRTDFTRDDSKSWARSASNTRAPRLAILPWTPTSHSPRNSISRSQSTWGLAAQDVPTSP